MTALPPPPRVDQAAAVADVLGSAGFTVDALEQLWGAQASAALLRDNPIPARRALVRTDVARTRLALLARLFVLGDAVHLNDDAAATDAQTRSDLRSLVEARLISSHGDSLEATVDLRPYAFIDSSGVGHWWICSDRGERDGQPLPEEHVLGVGGATMTLTRIMVQEAVERALDVGTGCGIQALHAARFARRVVATDLSERAIEFARFNAALNNVHSIEFRVGSLFDPVAQETFDLIVSNPPFVITPRVADVPAYVYRDGGMQGDDLTRHVIQGCADHLNPGGIAQILGNWETVDDRPGLDRVSGWIEDARGASGPLQALVVERAVQDPAEYAETWIRDGGTRPGTPQHEHLMTRWLDDFAARRVSAVGFGFVTLRRCASDQEFSRVERAHGGGDPGESWSNHVLTTLNSCGWLAITPDHQWDSTRLLTAPDVTEERSYWPGNDDPTVLRLQRGAGWLTSRRVDSAEAALVGACDGELTVGAIVAALAQIWDMSEDELRASLFPRVRELVASGFLSPPKH